ncbi:MAG: stage III sporulation protein AB [Ruminococcus sp.]|nr:stage III sporulation protein AB [Candidatus Apopatosoma intestinale]
MRWVGAGFLFCSVFGCGILLAGQEKERTRQCEAFLNFFEYIKNQIHYFLAPTKQIYRDYRDEVLSKTGFLDCLSQEGDGVYQNRWEEAFAACRDRIMLSREQAQIVLAFGSCIGKSNEEMQMNSFEYYIKAMTKETEKQRSVCAKNVKLYQTLGLTVGAMAALLFL